MNLGFFDFAIIVATQIALVGLSHLQWQHSRVTSRAYSDLAQTMMQIIEAMQAGGFVLQGVRKADLKEPDDGG